MLTKVSVEVAVVVAEVGPLQFAHSKLRSEFEGTLASVRLGDEALERIASNDEHHFVRSGDPSRVAALSETVRHGSADNRVDQDEIAVAIEASRTKRLLIDAEGESTVAHELIARDALFAEAEGASRETNQVLFDIGVIAEVLDLIRARHDLEEFPVTGCERLSEHLFTQERADLVEGLEVHRSVRKDGGELRSDLLHVTSEVRGERLSAVGNKLDARLDQVLIADVGVDDLKNGLLQRHLSLKVATFERSASLLDADTGSSATQGLKLELVLGASDLVRGRANATQGGVVHERRRSQRSSGDRHFFDNGTDHVRDVGQGAAIDGVDVGRFTSKNSTDLPNDTVDIFGREILDRRQRDTIVSHSFNFF